MGHQSTIYPKEVFMNDPRYVQTLAELLLYLHKRYVFIPKQITDTDNQYEEIKDIEYCYWYMMKFTVVDKERETHEVYLSENDIYAFESGLFEFLLSKKKINFNELDTQSIIFNRQNGTEVDNSQQEFWAMYLAYRDPIDRFHELKWLLDFSVL